MSPSRRRDRRSMGERGTREPEPGNRSSRSRGIGKGVAGAAPLFMKGLVGPGGSLPEVTLALIKGTVRYRFRWG